MHSRRLEVKMELEKLTLLHEHYRDSCSLVSAYRSARDRYFYLILAVLTVIFFDMYAPKGFSVIVSDFLKKRLESTSAPDLRYLKSVITFLLLGVTLRYCQVALLLERQYRYIHELETALSVEFPSPAFTREGKAYLADYPLFSTWAHYLYTAIFPLWLAVLVFYRIVRELPWGRPWAGLDWFDLAVGAAILLSLVFYLWAFHVPRRRGRSARTAR